MLLNKEDIPLVAKESMNVTHFEDVELINHLYSLILSYENDQTPQNQNAINEHFTKWFEHTLEHFRGEEEMMQKYNFPPYAIHKSEHDRALAQMDVLFRSWMSSHDIVPLKSYLQTQLPQWLIMHIGSMDRATAMFIASQN